MTGIDSSEQLAEAANQKREGWAIKKSDKKMEGKMLVERQLFPQIKGSF